MNINKLRLWQSAEKNICGGCSQEYPEHFGVAFQYSHFEMKWNVRVFLNEMFGFFRTIPCTIRGRLAKLGHSVRREWGDRWKCLRLDRIRTHNQFIWSRTSYSSANALFFVVLRSRWNLYAHTAQRSWVYENRGNTCRCITYEVHACKTSNASGAYPLRKHHIAKGIDILLFKK